MFREIVCGAKTERSQLLKTLDELDAGSPEHPPTITDRKPGSTRSATHGLTPRAHMAPDADVLGGLAEFERGLIRARIGEGRARAKARGVKMGRRFQMTPATPHQIKEAAVQRRNAGEPIRDITKSYDVSHSTILSLVRTPDSHQLEALK